MCCSIYWGVSKSSPQWGDTCDICRRISSAPQQFQLKCNLLLVNHIALEEVTETQQGETCSSKQSTGSAYRCRCIMHPALSLSAGRPEPQLEQMWADEQQVLRGNLRSSSINIRQLTLLVIFLCCPLYSFLKTGTLNCVTCSSFLLRIPLLFPCSNL